MATHCNSSEKSIFHFDYPELSESGYVEILENKIVVYFPEKNSSTASFITSQPQHQNTMLFVNKKLAFSTQWLPIYSANDLFKVKDMFSKCYYEYQAMNNFNICRKISYYTQYHSEIVTTHTTNHFTINCFENNFNTSIDITVENDPSTVLLESACNNYDVTMFSHVQLYIGKNKIFCSEREFGHVLSPTDVASLVNFIIPKLM